MDMDARIGAKLVEKMGCTHVPGVEQYMKNIMRKAKANCMGTVGRKGSASATRRQPKAVLMDESLNDARYPQNWAGAAEMRSKGTSIHGLRGRLPWRRS